MIMDITQPKLQQPCRRRDVVGENHKLISVFEPHKYSRVQSLFNEFCHAFSACDAVIVTEIYSASQQPIEGINQDSLIAGIKKSGVKCR